jgi:neprosin-like protein
MSEAVLNDKFGRQESKPLLGEKKMKNRMFCETIQRFQEKVRNGVGFKIAFGTTLTLLMLNGLVRAQSGPAEFVPFRNFIDQTVTAGAGDYLARPASKLKDAAAFEEMRQHILNMYQGVEVNHSFVLDSSHYDCVPIEQQPAVRRYGLTKIASPPPDSTLNKPAGADDDALQSSIKAAFQLDSERLFDAFGNSVQCEEHTIPMRRITLETMTRFPNLRSFFQKSPNEHVPGQEEKLTPGGGGPPHKYSYTSQFVNNLGGNSNLNVWSPYVNTAVGEQFSLSQEWYVGGLNTGVPPCGQGVQSCSIQTEEVGWVVYPAMFNDERPHFFIFSTPDGYNTGCWNNSCGDFVQVADAGLLGGWLYTSTYGGAQTEFSAEYYLFQGNWWLKWQGAWVGYYPGAMYHGGQNLYHAQLIQFGTEGVGTTIWPPEGSGIFPSPFNDGGYGWAAYQRDLWYINTSAVLVWDSLSPNIPSPECYNITGPFFGSGASTVYFYEGGPGGRYC